MFCVAALTSDVRSVTLQLVGLFNAFDHDNDSNGEHDFGAIEECGY